MTNLDVLRATFPAGTLTGAPKIRAMELIDELEPVKRGVYGGACGYLSYAGDMDVAIAIRTGIVKDGELHVQASAGVVADSVPELEWQRDRGEGARAAARRRAGRGGVLSAAAATMRRATCRRRRGADEDSSPSPQRALRPLRGDATRSHRLLALCACMAPSPGASVATKEFPADAQSLTGRRAEAGVVGQGVPAQLDRRSRRGEWTSRTIGYIFFNAGAANGSGTWRAESGKVWHRRCAPSGTTATRSGRAETCSTTSG